MDEKLIKLLNKHGYQVIDEYDFFILKRKLVKNSAKLVIFWPIAVVIITFGISGIYFQNNESGFIAIFIGLIIGSIPFWEYLISPFFSFYVDKDLRTILFRAKHSRAYKFSEITEMKLSVVDRYSDTNAFSSSNKEYDYRMDILFGGSREEVFKIIERDENSEGLIVEIKDYFEKLLE